MKRQHAVGRVGRALTLYQAGKNLRRLLMLQVVTLLPKPSLPRFGRSNVRQGLTRKRLGLEQTISKLWKAETGKANEAS